MSHRAEAGDGCLPPRPRGLSFCGLRLLGKNRRLAHGDTPAHVPTPDRTLGLVLGRTLSTRPTRHIVRPPRQTSIMTRPPMAIALTPQARNRRYGRRHWDKDVGDARIRACRKTSHPGLDGTSISCGAATVRCTRASRRTYLAGSPNIARPKAKVRSTFEATTRCVWYSRMRLGPRVWH